MQQDTFTRSMGDKNTASLRGSSSFSWLSGALLFVCLLSSLLLSAQLQNCGFCILLSSPLLHPYYPLLFPTLLYSPLSSILLTATLFYSWLSSTILWLSSTLLYSSFFYSTLFASPFLCLSLPFPSAPLCSALLCFTLDSALEKKRRVMICYI